MATFKQQNADKFRFNHVITGTGVIGNTSYPIEAERSLRVVVLGADATNAIVVRGRILTGPDASAWVDLATVTADTTGTTIAVDIYDELQFECTVFDAVSTSLEVWASGFVNITPASSTVGNVDGPLTSTDNAVARWDGAAGDTLQDSGIIISDGNVITGATNIISGKHVSLNNANAAFVSAYDTPTTQTADQNGLVLDYDTNFTTNSNALTGVVINIDGTDVTNKFFVVALKDSVPVFTVDIDGNVFFDGTINGTDPALFIIGPGLSTDNALVVYDGVDGALAKDSGLLASPTINDLVVPGVFESKSLFYVNAGDFVSVGTQTPQVGSLVVLESASTSEVLELNSQIAGNTGVVLTANHLETGALNNAIFSINANAWDDIFSSLQIYSQILFSIIDPTNTTQTGKIDFYVMESGIATNIMQLSGDGQINLNHITTITNDQDDNTLKLISTNGVSQLGPSISFFYDNTVGVAGDIVGDLHTQGKNAAGDTINYTRLMMTIGDPAAGSEIGMFDFQVRNGAAFNSILTIDADGPKVDSNLLAASSVISVTDNALVRFDGVTGAIIQDSTATIDDTGVLTMAGEIAMGTNKITGLGDPTNPQDAVTKNHFDTAQVASNVSMSVIGAPTYSSVQDLQNVFHSAGWLSGGDVTDNLDGTVAVASGTGAIRSGASAVSELLFFDWAASASKALTDLVQNYIYIDYNAGTPAIVVSISPQTDFFQFIELARVYRKGTELHINESFRQAVGDHASLMLQFNEDIMPYAHASGSAISETGTRNIGVTAGVFWQGLTRFTTTAFDSSVAGTFSYFYRDGIGGWTEVTAQTQIDNTQYDDGSGALATLTNNRYGVHWIYQETDSDIVVIYGRGDYNTLAAAQDADPFNDVPPRISTQGYLIGKIIIQKSASSFAEINSVFESSFSISPTNNHNELSGIQGGAATEYYHLTTSEHTVATQAATTSLDGFLSSTDWNTFNDKVDGPASSSDNIIPKFDLTTGKLLQESGITCDDSNNLTGLGTLNTRTIANWVDGPGTSTDGYIALWDGVTGKLLKDSTYDPSTIVIGPASSTDTAIALYNGITGKIIKDSVVLVDVSGNLTGLGTLNTRTIANWVDGPGSASDEAIARFDLTTGKLIQNSGVLISDTNVITGVTSIVSGKVVVQNNAVAAAPAYVSTYTAPFTQTGAMTGLVLDYDTNFTTNVNTFAGVVIKIDGTDETGKVFFNFFKDAGSVASMDINGNLVCGTVNGVNVTTLTGDVSGPGIAVTDNAIPRWDTTSGTNIQGSGVIIDDSNNITGVNNLTLGGGTITLSVDTNFVLTGGVNGVSFDSGVLSIDAANNRVGINTTAPTASFNVNGGTTLFGSVGTDGWIATGASGVGGFSSETRTTYAFTGLTNTGTGINWGLYQGVKYTTGIISGGSESQADVAVSYDIDIPRCTLGAEVRDYYGIRTRAFGATVFTDQLTIPYNTGLVTGHLIDLDTNITFTNAERNVTGLEILIDSGVSGSFTRDLIVGKSDTTVSLRLSANGAAVFNEAGNAVDFRVEGDTQDELLLIRGDVDKIKIGNYSTSEDFFARLTVTIPTSALGNPRVLGVYSGTLTGIAASSSQGTILISPGSQERATGNITGGDFADSKIFGPEYKAVGASTYTHTNALYVAASSQGANVTITNNWALGLSGSAQMIGGGFYIDRTGGTGTTAVPTSALDLHVADNGTCAIMRINATQANVTASDTFIEFRSTSGVEGSIAGTGSAGVLAYNTFTGSHWSQFDDSRVKVEKKVEKKVDKFKKIESYTEQDKDGKTVYKEREVECEEEKEIILNYANIEDGTLLVTSGKICKWEGEVANHLPMVKLSDKKEDKKIYGVFGGCDKDGDVMVLAIGSGLILVCDEGGKIESGDLLCSSSKPGYAMRYDGNDMRVVVAKAREDFNSKNGKIACTLLGG